MTRLEPFLIFYLPDLGHSDFKKAICFFTQKYVNSSRENVQKAKKDDKNSQKKRQKSQENVQNSQKTSVKNSRNIRRK